MKGILTSKESGNVEVAASPSQNSKLQPILMVLLPKELEECIVKGATTAQVCLIVGQMRFLRKLIPRLTMEHN